LSGEPGRELVRELLAELEVHLARAAGDTPPPDVEPPPQAAAASRATSWQNYANELRDLCGRVLEEADESTARAFWFFLIETAARHGPRGSSS
jgi:hypothetical protein